MQRIGGGLSQSVRPGIDAPVPDGRYRMIRHTRCRHVMPGGEPDVKVWFAGFRDAALTPSPWREQDLAL